MTRRVGNKEGVGNDGVGNKGCGSQGEWVTRKL